MAKVVKFAALAVGAAFVIASGGLGAGIAAAFAAATGIGAATLGLVAAGLSLGASLLSGKQKPPDRSPSDRDRLFASIDPRTPRKQVSGTTALATDIRDQEFTGANQEYFHRFIVVASHRVHAIDEIWFDDKLAWTAIGGVQGEFAGYLTVTPVVEGNASNAINISGRMGSSRRYTGCAYVHLRYKLTGNSKKAESPFASSVPTRVTIKGSGRFCYDPRLDSTAGGSGPHRADDQSTWGWDDSYCRNPAIQMLNYLLGWRINGKLAVGKGIPPTRLDLASFIEAANICDETVALAGGGTEPRYRSDGIFSEADPMNLVLDSFKATMNGLVDDSDGRIKCKVLVDDTADVIASFTADHIISDVKWRPHADVTDRFNVVRGTFTDPGNASLFQSVDYPAIEIDSPDGIERAFPLDLPLVQSVTQAQRLAALRLNRAQFAGTLEGVWNHEAWKVQKYDVVEQSFPALGFVDKLFRVVAITVRPDGTVPMVMRVEDAAIYTPVTEQPPIEAVPGTPWDPVNNPLLPTRGAYRLVSQTVAYPISSDDDSVIVAAFDGVIDDGRSISFPATTLDGLASGTSYGVFWHIGAGAYLAVPSPATAAMSSDAYVFIAWSTTSTDGEYAPGETPPPGWGGGGSFPTEPAPI